MPIFQVEYILLILTKSKNYLNLFSVSYKIRNKLALSKSIS